MARCSDTSSSEAPKQLVWDALALDRDDDVATALRDLPAGASVRVQLGASELEVTLIEPIPLCHKLALRSLELGDPIRKFGQVIGAATAPVAVGAWVHVHNLASLRARQPPRRPPGQLQKDR